MKNFEIEKAIKNVLLKVKKPARYIGDEYGIPEKDFLNVKIRFALVFPELYEIGMSNIAIKILYTYLNNCPDISCERVFHPWEDFEKELINNDIPLYGLETYTPLYEFDIIGFSIPYEILFTNVLNILKLGRIPLKKEFRNDSHPIILAGGNGINNPLPLLPFIDAFYFGEADSNIVNIVLSIKNKKSRNEKLSAISKIEGIYIPELSNIPVKRVVETDLNALDPVFSFPVPSIQVTQDRVAIEIARGCSHGCRFCQAGYVYRPVRERNIDLIVLSLKKMIEKTGYNEVSLISLSASDYSKLDELLELLDYEFSPNNINISLPSLRIDSFTSNIAIKLSKVRKSGLTFAVESAENKIRNYINKNITENELFNTLDFAITQGWNLIKLYFMIGIEENDEEIKIANLLQKILDKYKKLNINITLSTFVPKPFTPFEKNKQLTAKKALEKILYLKNKFYKEKRIKFKYQSPEMSEIEGILARGDKKIAELLEKMHLKGSKFDAWQEFFDYSKWIETLKELNIDIENELNEKVYLPFKNIQYVLSPIFLENEKKISKKYELTQDCRKVCANCGICSNSLTHKYAQSSKFVYKNNSEVNKDNKQIIYIVAKFIKDNIYIGHRDLMNVFSMAFNRSKINILFSEGFNPHPKFQIPGSLPLGIYSKCEYIIFPIYNMLKSGNETNNILEELNNSLPKGIILTDIISTNKKIRDTQNLLNYSVYKIDNISNYQKIYDLFENREIIKNNKKIKLKNVIENIEIFNNHILLSINNNLGIREIINDLFGNWQEYTITRINFCIKQNNKIYNFFEWIKINN